jgi:hypothetical protein
MTFSPSHKTLVLLIGALGIAMPATAQESSEVKLVGVAKDLCFLGQAEPGDGPLENFENPTGAIFIVTELTDPLTLTTRAADLSLKMNAMCNTPHRLIVSSQNDGLWRTEVTAATSGFGSAVPYRLGLSWADETRDLAATAASRQAVEWELLIGRPATGNVQLDLSIGAGSTNAGLGAPLLSGSYSDVVTVTVESQ